MIASFHLAASLSKDTPIMFKPLACNSLYSATTLGFSFLQGAHHEAQKSMSVTFPKDCFKEITFPSGFLALKSGAVLPSSVFFFLELLFQTLQFVFLSFYQR